MNAHQRLEQQLRKSVVALGGRRPALASRVRLWWRGLPVLVILSLTTVTVAAAAVSLVLSRPPVPGPIPRNVADGVVAASFNAATAKDRTCQSPVFRRLAGTTAMPSREMLATLPVLRGEETGADRRLTRMFTHEPLGRLMIGPGQVYLRYIRQARVADGFTFYLIPVTKLGRRALSPAAADHCDQLATAALQARLPSVPAAQRAATRRYGDAEFTSWRYNLATAHLYDGVSLEASEGPHAGGGGDVQALSTIRQTGMLGETDSVWYGIVPPGVATVTLRFATGGRGDHHHGPLSVSSNVINSVYAINIPSNPQGDGWPTSAIWRSKTGHVIKRINETPFHP